MNDKRTDSESGEADIIDIRSRVTAAQQKSSDNERYRAISIIAEAVELERSKPPLFLQAWKDGIELIGEAHFVITANTVLDATDKFQLRPDFDIIRDSLPGLSGGQSRFLIGMCHFYSDSGISELLRDLQLDQPSLADYALLDDRHRSILIRLINSYTGW